MSGSYLYWARKIMAIDKEVNVIFNVTAEVAKRNGLSCLFFHVLSPFLHHALDNSRFNNDNQFRLISHLVAA